MTKNKFISKTFFTPRTSFWVGIGSVLNVPGNYYDFIGYDDGLVLDNQAIESDWNKVGRDISQAINKITQENEKFDEKAIKK